LTQACCSADLRQTNRTAARRNENKIPVTPRITGQDPYWLVSHLPIPEPDLSAVEIAAADPDRSMMLDERLQWTL
jgi:hypothetical protein